MKWVVVGGACEVCSAFLTQCNHDDSNDNYEDDPQLWEGEIGGRERGREKGGKEQRERSERRMEGEGREGGREREGRQGAKREK